MAFMSARQQPQDRLKLDIPTAAKNLGVFAVLAGVITFAVVMLVDVIVSALGGVGIGVERIGYYGLITFIGSVATGILYVPAANTVNERLFRWAAIAVVVAITLSQVVAIGQEWGLFTVLTGMACLAGACFIAPNRVSTAYVERTETPRSYAGVGRTQQVQPRQLRDHVQAPQHPNHQPNDQPMRDFRQGL